MYGQDRSLSFDSLIKGQSFSDQAVPFVYGGLFLDDHTVSPSFVSLILKSGGGGGAGSSSGFGLGKTVRLVKRWRGGGGFLSVSLSVKGSEGGYVGESSESWGPNEDGQSKGAEMEVEEETVTLKVEENEKDLGVLLKDKFFVELLLRIDISSPKFVLVMEHSKLIRTFVAPLERLKLEYIVRGEQKNFFDLIKTIAATQGLKGFWKGNFVNILRTAPFKAINFYAYDTYRSYLLKLTGNEETTNFERFVAGAASGITATLLCLPLDTIRTVMVAPGGEALGGLIGAFRHMIQTEGFFSLYKGLVPSIASMAPSGAVFYGVYDILKSAYLHSPEGRKRIQYMKQGGQELNALEQLELGPIRTLLYGAIAGACAEAATYPFEVVRRQLQMQVHATKLSALATCVKIVEQGGFPALYAGLIPSLLQVLPSAAISYFVYEFMKIVLKVESA
ncbi:hypothetical protein Patl1_27220 [Pistacia atlantica]|uniref:Uncharacterized protein n=1 Tax=Pistacia atlantica TaxID=434234 RepID=A0ACC1BF05_9ROSI|nr:hypothetical protein Patl1_27220 [Pistacia atlantica]